MNLYSYTCNSEMKMRDRESVFFCHTHNVFFRRKFFKYICFINACTCIYAYNSFKYCLRCMRDFMRGHLIGRNSDCPISGGGCSLRELKQRAAGWRPVRILVATCSRNMYEKTEFKCCTYKYSNTI